ncbi:MAG: hypothetical protein AAGJ18_17955 [Bacteroidota bacterium]
MSKTKFRKTAYLLLLLLNSFSIVLSGQDRVFFKQPSSTLDISKIRNRVVFEDSHGFIWVGTVDGLMRYDGYQNKVYRYDANDNTSIAESQIKWITEDAKGFLWIVNMNGMLNKFDPITETFQLVELPQQKEKSPLVLHKLICQDGRLWLRMESGELFLTTNQQPALDQLIETYINDFTLQQNVLWVSTNKGLRYWSDKQRSLLIPAYKGEGKQALLKERSWRLWVDPKGMLWTVVKDKFYQVDPVTYQVNVFYITEPMPFLGESLYQYHFIVDGQNRIWIWQIGT